MPQELVPVKQTADLARPTGDTVIPAPIAALGEEACWAFLNFFTARTSNDNTRKAYHRATADFFTWIEDKNLTLPKVRPAHVAAYFKELSRRQTKRKGPVSVASVKQALAAIRMLFDHLVVAQVVPSNPALSVRGPALIVEAGRTPVLTGEEARQLLDTIDTSHVVGLRDRAVIAVMVYTFARVGATVALNVENYFPQGKRWFLELHEKRGKVLRMPAHHNLEEYLDGYLNAADLWDDKKGPLFHTAAGKTKTLTRRRMTTKDVWEMVRRRAADARIETRIGCHTFRATGITNYLENGGTLEKAQQMAGHSSAKTTKLYDRRSDQVTLDEVEKIQI